MLSPVAYVAYNRKVGLALLCPITSRVKGYPFEVALSEGLARTSSKRNVRHVLDASAREPYGWATRIASLPCFR